MLKGITWWQFSKLMVLMIAVYYLYVFIRYYGTDLAWTIVRGKSAKAGRKVLGRRYGRLKDGQGQEDGLDQPELFEKNEDGQIEEVQQTHKALSVLRKVIAQGIENKLDRQNMLDHIREVLGEYPRLRKTDHAEAINSYLVRAFESELSLELDENELAGLWK